MSIDQTGDRETVYLDIPDDLAEFLEEYPRQEWSDALLQFCDESMDEWAVLLDSYIEDDRGSITEGTVSVDVMEPNEAGGWSMSVSAEEYVGLGCRDCDVNSDMQIVLDLTVDLPGRKISIMGAACTEERTPDEEL